MSVMGGPVVPNMGRNGHSTSAGGLPPRCVASCGKLDAPGDAPGEGDGFGLATADRGCAAGGAGRGGGYVHIQLRHLSAFADGVITALPIAIGANTTFAGIEMSSGFETKTGGSVAVLVSAPEVSITS